MPSGVEIKDIDRGYKEISGELNKIETTKPYVKVGILESAGTHGNSGLTVAQVATFQEFGTDRIPERSFMRTTFDEKSEEINDFIYTLKIKEIMDTGKVLRLAGEKIKSLIQRRIRSITQPPLAEATIEAKGSSKPLIDTGQMINSINYEVHEEGDK